MNYKKVYDKIIENRLNNPLDETEYGENHHIIPRSLGGSDEIKNLVRLTAREHFICHALLAEMYERETNEWYKMNHAFMMMKSSRDYQDRYFNSRLYELKRKDFSKVMSGVQSGKKNSQYGKVWIYNLDLEQSIKVYKSELDYYLETGWVKGRVLNFSKFKIDQLDRDKFQKEKKVSKKNKQLKNKNITTVSKTDLKKKLYVDLYTQYLNSECTTVKEFAFTIKLNKQTLYDNWKKYINGYPLDVQLSKRIKATSISVYGEKNGNYGYRYINNGLVEKRIHSSENLPIGFNYGRLETIWVHNIITKKNTRIPKTSDIPTGYKVGRLWNR